MKAGLMIIMLLLSNFALANVEIREFETNSMEQRYKVLINELRCLVCQNQNLADSNAELAQDLRKQVFEMINNGDSDEQIIDFMVNRYGDFVLYRPPVKSSTLFLWVGPFLLLLLGIVILSVFVKRQKQHAQPLTETEQQQAEQLLQATSKDKN